MKWRDRRQSSNISSQGRGRVGMGVGVGGILMGLLVFALTGNPLAGLQAGLSGGGLGPKEVHQEALQLSQKEKELYQYSAVVLADTEDQWGALFQKEGRRYNPPKMAIFQETVRSGCGIAQSGMGPFYCGEDQKIYMDLSFYDELIKKFGAKEGDFVLSYVISHEVGHHVQKELGILDRVNALRSRASQQEANALTVRLELMADYLAGVVARYQKDQGYLEAGDIEEAISTAWSIGDDTLQQKAGRRVQPESFTHGSSEQRTRWFKKGYEAGDLSEMDTFDTRRYPTPQDL